MKPSADEIYSENNLEPEHNKKVSEEIFMKFCLGSLSAPDVKMSAKFEIVSVIDIERLKSILTMTSSHDSAVDFDENMTDLTHRMSQVESQ